MFTKNRNMAPEPRKRGRPRGRSAQGDQSRHRLYFTAMKLFAERGYEATTLREIARVAGVSPGLLYRYFPSKRAVVLELYETLSAEYAERALEMPEGKWRDRFRFALDTSLEVLGPHRTTLVALVPVLVGDPDDGVFSDKMTFSRQRVERAFAGAVSVANDAPSADIAKALGRLLYLIHLAIILWWLLDKSPEQRATAGLVLLVGQTLPLAAMTLRLPSARSWVLSAEALASDALLSN